MPLFVDGQHVSYMGLNLFCGMIWSPFHHLAAWVRVVWNGWSMPILKLVTLSKHDTIWVRKMPQIAHPTYWLALLSCIPLWALIVLEHVHPAHNHQVRISGRSPQTYAHRDTTIILVFVAHNVRISLVFIIANVDKDSSPSYIFFCIWTWVLSSWVLSIIT